MTASCTRCGAEFEARGAWQRLCWRCWRADQDAKRERGAYDAGYSDGYRAGAAVRRTLTKAPRLDAATIRQLVQLCHPDRHPPERAALANRATATLLDLLDRERDAA